MFRLIIYYVLQWTWGIIQNIIGLALFAANAFKKHYRYKGAVITEWNFRRGSVGLGMFIFVSVPRGGIKDPAEAAALEKTICHEYGHTLQSIILGPLFLPVIGIPSLMWCGFPCFVNYRKRKDVSYYWFYTERWANSLAKIKL